MEIACLPTTSKEQRQELLKVVVCGGGPTVMLLLVVVVVVATTTASMMFVYKFPQNVVRELKLLRKLLIFLRRTCLGCLAR